MYKVILENTSKLVFKVLIPLFVFLDMISTYLCLRFIGAGEENPTIAWLYSYGPGFLWLWFFAVLIYFVPFYLLSKEHELAWPFCVALGTSYFFVLVCAVINNFTLFFIHI